MPTSTTASPMLPAVQHGGASLLVGTKRRVGILAHTFSVRVCAVRRREADLLLRWRDLMLESDPDIIIGYNTTNFDLPYLYE
eukprot:359943-Chlamydomonas_euryale.AAC.2